MGKHYIDKRIFEDLADLEANPPVEAWLNISEALDKRSRKRRVPAFLGVAASIVVLAAIAFSLWLTPPEPVTGEMADVRQPDAELMAGIDARLPGLENPPGLLQVTRPGTQATPEEPNEPLQVSPNRGIRMNTVAGHLPQAPGRPDNTFEGYRQGQIAALFSNDPTDEPFISRKEEMKNQSKGKLSFGAHFAPQQNQRLLARNTDFSTSSIPFESLEEGILTYGAGISVSYQVSRALSVQTGLNYINTGQYVNDIYSYKHPGDVPLFDADRSTGILVHPQTVITSQGSIRFHDAYHYFADVRSHRVITNKQSMDVDDVKSLRQTSQGLTQVFQFVELPVNFRYEVISGYARLQVKGGVSVNYMLGNDVYAGQNIFQQSIGETHGVRTLNFAAMGGFSLSVPLTGKMSLHLEPTAQIFLNPILQEGLMIGHAYPYNYSIQTGISYGF